MTEDPRIALCLDALFPGELPTGADLALWTWAIRIVLGVADRHARGAGSWEGGPAPA